MTNCIFCKIAKGGSEASLIYEDNQVVAFKDINPQAPIHILIIPKVHYSSIRDVTDESLIGHLFTTANQVAKEMGISDYRLVVNTGPRAGQSVFHLHLHLLGGRTLYWPPG